MSGRSVRLRLRARTTLLEFEGDETVTLPVGLRDLAEDVLQHEPPTSTELERAIDVVEGALAASRLARADRGALAIADGMLQRLPGLFASATSIPREAVEAQFQRLASRSLGTLVAETDLPSGRDAAAALLILRECMHHLGFDSVQLTAD